MKHALYLRAVAWKFRWHVLTLAALVALGALLYRASPNPPPVRLAIYGAWMALFAQPIALPATWYLGLMCAVYPLFGFVLVGEGVVRLALLMVSRELGDKEWMKVMASTYRDHVIVCGLGHLGSRIVQELTQKGQAVVVIEKRAESPFVATVRAAGVPVLLRDMREDQSLIDAGVAQARAVILATNDDIANLEVALDARRMNPKIRILLRMFDQQIASKIKDALAIDHAFSSASLAAPMVVNLLSGEERSPE